MADDDTDSGSQGPVESGIPIPLVAPGRPAAGPRKGPVLELAQSDPDLDDPPSLHSVDDLLMSLEPIDDGPSGPVSSEENEPLVLNRGAMLRSAFPPPLPPPPAKPGAIDRPQKRSSPPVRPPLASPQGPPPLPAPVPPPAPAKAAVPPPLPAPSPPAALPVPPPPLPARAPPVAPPVAVEKTPRVRAGTMPPPLPTSATRVPVLELLSARIASLEARGDRIALARALSELAIVQEISDDTVASTRSATAALAKDPALPAMHAFLRRKLHSRDAVPALLAHVDEEITQAPEGPLRTSLLTERARLLTAGGRDAEALAAWSHVLAIDPQDPAALRGKEAALARSDQVGRGLWEAEEEHLDAMAVAYAEEPRLAAWLEVERAAILEHRLEKIDAARLALTTALAKDSRVGAVRRALIRHVARQRDTAALVNLLDEEALIEPDTSRAARLELEAATVAEGASRDAARAIELLERAAKRAPTARSVDIRVFADLTRLLEAAGRGRDAIVWRRARLAHLLAPSTDERAEELRALARACEKAGDLEAAIADLENALEARADAPTVAHLDRLLEMSERHDARIALWVRIAARGVDVADRVTSLLRAADVAERALGRPDEALRHLQTAWTTKPGHAEVLDALSRLLAKKAEDDAAHPSLELFAHAVHVSDDAGRKVAYLERVALLAEETVGDFARAAEAYEKILELEPNRLSAWLGLARSAARKRDDRTVHRALMAQARISRSETEALALQTRAASAVARVDPALALAVATDVLVADATHAGARSLVTRLHEDAGRWELVARSLESHIAHLPPPRADERHALLLYLAEVELVRLKAPVDALATLQRARESHGRAHDARLVAAIARVLENVGDAKALRDAYESLASSSTQDDERAGHLIRAAEICEHRLRDDAAAVRAYEQALAAAPEDAKPLVADRLERLRARSKDGVPTHPLDRAFDLVTRGVDDVGARSLLEPLASGGHDVVPALRLLQRLHRKANAWGPLALVLAQEAETYAGVAPRLGALWALADLEEWNLDPKREPTTYARILALHADDPAALAATVRTRLAAALAGDDSARLAVIGALRRRATLETRGERAATELLLAHLLELESDDSEANDAAADEALERYHHVLAFDDACVTAAWGMRRLAHRLGRTALAAQATMTLAELSVDPKARARHFVEAADLLADVTEGTAEERQDQPRALLERALESDPECLAAARALLELDHDLEPSQQQPGELVRALRLALERASEPQAVIFLGTEVAKLAREQLRDIGVATQAMQKVRDVAPTHAPSLLTLADLYMAQRAWAEAVETLETVAAKADVAQERLTALFALGSVYGQVLARPDEHERVLRAALAIEPKSPRALRGLIEPVRVRLAKTRRLDDGAEKADDDELASLLGRLAKVETDPALQCDALLEVSDLKAKKGDLRAAEKAIVEAIVRCPSNARAFARLAAFFRKGSDVNVAAYAKALQDLIALGRESGLADARWFAALGQLEVDTLRRLEEGIAHLEWAVQLDPTLHETRFELADAYAKTGARDQAVQSLMALVVPDARPLASLADAGVALALLEKLLEQGKRPEEAVVVSELRAVLGDLEPGRAQWLDARRLAAFEEHHERLGRTALVESVLPKVGRHVLLEVAAAGAGLDAKLLRTNIADLAVHARDRIGSRSGHPVRPAFDRVVSALGLDDVELVVSPVTDRVRVVIQDTPWVVVPGSFEKLPEAVQVASLARAGARVLLGVPWLADLRDAVMLGWVVAVARQVVPSYAAEGLASGVPDADAQARGFEPLVSKAIARKQRKLLEGLVPHLSLREGRPPEWRAFMTALDQCTARVSYLVSGNLQASTQALALEDAALQRATAEPGVPGLTALLAHPLAGNVARFALTPEATALRQRLGSSWTR